MKPTDNNKLLTWVIVASQFAPPFMFAGVAVALPDLDRELAAGATALGLIESLFLAGSAAFMLPVGWLADAADKRTLYKLGLLGFGLAAILIGASSWVGLILVTRFLQGIMSAVFASTGPAILTEIAPPHRRGAVFGASLGAICAGLTLGPIISGYLVQIASWRAVFFFGAAVLLVVFVIVLNVLPSEWCRPTTRVHMPSIVLVVAAMLCLVIGSESLSHGLTGYAWLAAGLTMGLIFIAWQYRLDNPLLDIAALIRNRDLRNALLIQFPLYLNAYSVIFMLSIFMQITLGFTPQRSGFIIAAGAVSSTIMAPLSGRLADHLRPRIITTAGVATVLASTLLALWLDSNATVPLVVLVLVVHGVGFGLFASPNMTVIMNSVPAGSISMASALGAKARSLGVVIGMIVITMLIARAIGDAPIRNHPREFAAIMHAAFQILSATTAIALSICLYTLPRKVERAP